MSDNEAGQTAGKGWSDREKLVYLYGLMEASSTGPLNYTEAPRAAGRTPKACRLMVDRLKNALKDDLDALKAGHAISEQGGVPKGVRTPKTPKTPSKRKTKGADEDGSPKKRGRPAAKKKEVDEAEPKDEAEMETVIKEEQQDYEHFGLDDGI